MKYRIAFVLFVLAVLSRLMPHWPNFTALGAVSLFGAAYLERRWLAWVTPFVAVFLSDLFLNNVVYSAYYTEFQWITSWYLYAALGIMVLLGAAVLSNRATPKRVLVSSLSASIIFFLVTNYGTWATGLLYPKTFAGLVSCYVAGLPYLGNMLSGDLFFSAVLFGGYAWVFRNQLALARN